MKPFEKCPNCSGELVEKNVEKVVRGGNDAALVMVSAEICLHCGERLYSPETVQQFEQIRFKLERREVKEFHRVGHVFQTV